MRRLAAVTLVAVGTLLASCAEDIGPDAAPSSVVVTASGPASTETPSVTSVRIGPLTPRDPERIRAEARTAIELLGESTAGPPADGEGHVHSATIEAPLLTGDKATFANQWLAAEHAVSRFDTLEEVAALGYVRSSAPISGIGSHWVLWPQLAQPFDPSQPSMLLFDESRDPARLVGYSYWVQSPTEPDGFAGPNDHWHQHQGLCVVNGWVDRERVSGPDSCAGTFLAGGDLWMLHAWPVSGYENADGKFATFNPMLCPSYVGTPDISRCPEE